MLLKSTLCLIQLTIVLIYVPINEADETDYRVNGDYAEEGEFPYQVSLQYYGQHICGGSILENCWILTSAYCVVGYEQSALTILAGTTKLNSGGVRAEIEKIIPHEKYKPMISNNIAVIKLRKCLTYNKNIQPVKLDSTHIRWGVIGIVTGWEYTDENGTYKPNDLMKLRVRTIKNQQCIRSFQNIEDGNLCTLNRMGQGFCQGDSGGPLVEEKSKAQMGLRLENSSCILGRPDLYTRISTYVNWITDNTE